ncbi:ATP-binding protein [Microbispora sp. SCL1-1]|uniref:AlbA family DNA-binding domain-containing protein n=1 Tax=unclassified Microbispora TaxID=2614687 RepID=UPI001159989E|nr:MULTISPECIES: ATP-binding protein [unclassified Microbispora]NJP27774.1 ATP-binding protein [Microbispora sp. CL1-1]TQS10547.1 ATP-binding protein [Microbispora sp. SCL1-1]
MSLMQALLHAAPSEVTIDQVRRLVAMVGPEAPTIEYKADMTSSIAKAVAALANTYGGLVLVGVTDDRKITGVKEKTIERVAQHCHSTIEPPWVPDIVPVPLDDGSGKYVLVLRVVPGIPPRPLLVEGAAPIRHSNTTHPASWQQLAALFAENDTLIQADPWVIRAPDLPQDGTGNGGKVVDLIVRSGLNIAINPRAAWRPLGEQRVDQLAEALNRSSLVGVLTDLASSGGDATIRKFHRQGHNRSRVIRLQWRGLPPEWKPTDPVPVEALLSAEVPGGYGRTATHLYLHLDVVTRLGFWNALNETRRTFVNGGELDISFPFWRIDIAILGKLMDAVIAALVDEGVVGAIADLAQVDPLAIPQPRVLHMVTQYPVSEILDTSELRVIPDAGNSHGAHLLADPGLDLTDLDNRREQINTWLVQTALDAGLLGMEHRLGTLSPW